MLKKILFLMVVSSFTAFTVFSAQEVTPAAVTPIRIQVIPLMKLPPFDTGDTFLRFNPEGTTAHIETILYRTYWTPPGSEENPVELAVHVVTSSPEGLFYDNKNRQINFFHQGNLVLCANVKPGWHGRDWKIIPTGNCKTQIYVEPKTAEHEAQFVIEMLLKN